MHPCNVMYRRLTWLLLWAMLFGAMAPTLTHWLVAGRQAARQIVWTEICRPGGGTQQIQIAFDAGTDASPAPLSPPLVAQNHCDYCLLAQHLTFLPTPRAVWQVPEDLRHVNKRHAHDQIVFCSCFLRDGHPTRAPPDALNFA